METLIKVIDFLTINYDIILTMSLAVITILITIARITPTKTDDKIVDILKRGFDLFKSNIKVEDLNKLKSKIEKK